ncbi:hypothetical protein KBTX_01307 [wastewater metagenome]|uniref:Uncharacterized protein n=3 Tax=root TaxID=1 RepID=A0A5B8R7C1_9ZZZZ|nr:hypothetical protein KBTEX_01307 [uncultured organism]
MPITEIRQIMQAALSATPAVLTIELDPEVVARGARPPEPLSRDAAEVLGQAVAADLHRILGETVTEAGLIIAGGLYDLTELLQPGLPMTEALLEVYRGSLRGAPFTPHRLSLGCAGGRFPLPAVAPRRSPGAGPMLALPFALVAPGPTLDTVRQVVEERLLERGAPALATDQVVRQQFGLEPVNLAYASFHDLSALLKVQLEHAGFGSLWALLEGALYRPDEPVAIHTEEGNTFLGLHGRAWTPFLTLDEWARHMGSDDPAGYDDWLRRQRQYTAGLTAHGVEVTPTLPRPGVFSDNAEMAITVADQASLADTTQRREPRDGDPAFGNATAITLTEQRLPGVGPFAYTVLAQRDDGAIAYLGNDYPMAPEAVPAIQAHWRERAEALGAGFHVEQPATAVTGGEPPQLMPWLDYQGSA